jgi:hypothetical protein
VHSERRRSIIVWGPPGSGKSLYLSALVLWLPREREVAHLVILPADSRSAAWLASRTRTDGGGILLDAARGATPPNRFRIYSTLAGLAAEQRSAVVAELTAGDAVAGDPSLADLESALGVLLLLPAAAMAADSAVRDAHVRWLTTTLARLPESAGAAPPAVSLPVAVCLTQADAVPDASRRDPTRWLESFGSEPIRALRAHCARFEIFKLSALGQTPRHRDGLEVLASMPEPRDVLAPIRWILDASLSQVAA